MSCPLLSFGKLPLIPTRPSGQANFFPSGRQVCTSSHNNSTKADDWPRRHRLLGKSCSHMNGKISFEFRTDELMLALSESKFTPADSLAFSRSYPLCCKNSDDLGRQGCRWIEARKKRGWGKKWELIWTLLSWACQKRQMGRHCEACVELEWTFLLLQSARPTARQSSNQSVSQSLAHLLPHSIRRNRMPRVQAHRETGWGCTCLDLSDIRISL